MPKSSALNSTPPLHSEFAFCAIYSIVSGLTAAQARAVITPSSPHFLKIEPGPPQNRFRKSLKVACTQRYSVFTEGQYHVSLLPMLRACVVPGFAAARSITGSIILYLLLFSRRKSVQDAGGHPCFRPCRCAHRCWPVTHAHMSTVTEGMYVAELRGNGGMKWRIVAGR